MHVAAVQFDIVWEDKPANHRIIESMLDAAPPPAGAFVLLPELGDTGFSFNLDTIVDDQTLSWACDLARERTYWVQAGFARRAADGTGRNCAAIIDPEGQVRGIYEKLHPFSFGRESEHYTGGDTILVEQCGDAVVAPMICYDLRFPELWRLAALAGAEIYSIGASWPDARQAHWRALAIARAIENQAYVVAVNRIGSDPALSYAGGSIIVSPQGTVLAEASCDQTVLHAELDVTALRHWRREFPALRDVRRSLLGAIDRA